MALFQPSNITPSAWAGEGQGVVNADSNISISWQVNGTSALRSFSIAIYPNTGDAETDSVLVANLVGTVDASVYPNGFYPTDANGDPQYYTYEPGISWASVGIVDGNSYKYKITQYSSEQQGGVEQNGFSSFVTRALPSMFIFNSGEDTARVTLTGTFYQPNGDAISSVRWQIYRFEQDHTRTLIRDTGFVYTSKLEYVLDGAANNYSYLVFLSIRTTSGYLRTVSKEFYVDYDIEPLQNTTEFEYEDGGVKISFPDTAISIPVTDSNNYSVNTEQEYLDLPTSSSFVEWSEIPQSENQNGTIKWSTEISGIFEKFLENNYFGYAETGYNGRLIDLSPNGRYIADIFSNPISQGQTSFVARIGLVGSGNTISLLETIETNLPIGVKFCPVGSSDSSAYWLFVPCLSGIKLFKILRTTNNISYIGLIGSGRGYTYDNVYDIDFSKDGKNFVIVGSFSDRAHFYSFDIDTGTATFKTQFTPSAFALARVSFNPQVNMFMVSNTQPSSSPNHGVWFYTYTTEVPTLYGNGDTISGLSLSVTGGIGFSTDGQYAIVSGSGNIYRFNINSSSETLTSIGFNAVYEAGNNADFKFFIGATDLLVKTTIGSTVETKLFRVNGASVDYIGSSEIGTPIVYDKFNTTIIFLTPVSYGGDKISSGGWYFVNTTAGYTLLSLFKNSTTPFFTAKRNGANFVATLNGTEYSVPLQSSATVELTPTTIKLNGTLFSISQTDLRFTTLNLSGVQKCEEFYSTIGTTFVLYFGDSDLDGGTYSESGSYANVFYLKGSEKIIANVPTAQDSFIDYGSKSGETREYNIFFKQPNGSYISEMQTDPICQKFNAFYLFETTQDENVQSIYHVQKMWKFGNNAESGSISNNNAPNWLTNFTKYRLKQSVRRTGRTGTLSALISNAVNGVYNDTAQQMDELFAASQSQNTFFLKDPKGNLYMVAISAPIQSQIRLGSTKLETTVSIPWEEVGDAANASLVAYPNDGGWQE